MQQEYDDVREDEYVVHGNIRCRNVFVFSFDSNKELKVKLGDPGMVDVYNHLPISHTVNEERVPWVAPELIDVELGKTYSWKFADVYSFGVFLCELFTQAERPFAGLALRQVHATILLAFNNVAVLYV